MDYQQPDTRRRNQLTTETEFHARLEEWFARGEPAVVVRITGTKGSAPRGADAAMGVTLGEMAGTIGGGQLEWLALGRARRILSGETPTGELEIALGPELGQCCGGRVSLGFGRLDEIMLDNLAAARAGQLRNIQQVLIFGAGHTGKALAAAMAALPFKSVLVDTRPESFTGGSSEIETLLTAMPESPVRDAPPASAFVAMTHEHHLDFLIMAEALRRTDAAYCGMIGSRTKRAVFISWLNDNGYPPELAAKLVCPIGGPAVRDKRPEVIAALTAAEIILALHQAAVTSQGSG